LDRLSFGDSLGRQATEWKGLRWHALPSHSPVRSGELASYRRVSAQAPIHFLLRFREHWQPLCYQIGITRFPLSGRCSSRLVLQALMRSVEARACLSEFADDSSGFYLLERLLPCRTASLKSVLPEAAVWQKRWGTRASPVENSPTS